jgi:divalent metal cation (Fe/Co/Zn/Cd) transporter
MHLAPKQILINAHVNLRNDLVTDDIERTNEEIESLIMKAEPKVALIFLETARKGHKINAKRKVVPEPVA